MRYQDKIILFRFRSVRSDRILKSMRVIIDDESGNNY